MMNQNNYISNWKRFLGFRNMQEKLEKVLFLDKPTKSTAKYCPTVLSYLDLGSSN